MIIQAQHQRTEVIALAVRETSDDEFLAGLDFDFVPVLSAASFVLAGAAFGQDTFEAVGSCGFEHRGAVGDEVIRKPDVIGGSQDFFEQRLAILERNTAQVVAIQIQQVEQEQRDGSGSRQVGDAVGIRDRDSGLDEAEAGAAIFIQHRDLAIQNRAGCF